MFNDSFLTIPVYRLDEDSYFSQMKKDLENSLPDTWDEEFCKKHPDLVRKREQHHHLTYGGAWEFNEIIGFIKLYFLGTQIRGEYWSTLQKRKVKTRRKQFEYKTHKISTEVEIRAMDSASILSAIEDYLERSKKELKNRHLDLREFNTIKAHIDWYKLYKTVPLA